MCKHSNTPPLQHTRQPLQRRTACSWRTTTLEYDTATHLTALAATRSLLEALPGRELAPLALPGLSCERMCVQSVKKSCVFYFMDSYVYSRALHTGEVPRSSDASSSRGVTLPITHPRVRVHARTRTRTHTHTHLRGIALFRRIPIARRYFAVGALARCCLAG